MHFTSFFRIMRRRPDEYGSENRGLPKIIIVGIAIAITYQVIASLFFPTGKIVWWKLASIFVLNAIHWLALLAAAVALLFAVLGFVTVYRRESRRLSDEIKGSLRLDAESLCRVILKKNSNGHAEAKKFRVRANDAYYAHGLSIKEINVILAKASLVASLNVEIPRVQLDYCLIQVYWYNSEKMRTTSC